MNAPKEVPQPVQAGTIKGLDRSSEPIDMEKLERDARLAEVQKLLAIRLCDGRLRQVSHIDTGRESSTMTLFRVKDYYIGVDRYPNRQGEPIFHNRATGDKQKVIGNTYLVYGIGLYLGSVKHIRAFKRTSLAMINPESMMLLREEQPSYAFSAYRASEMYILLLNGEQVVL